MLRLLRQVSLRELRLRAGRTALLLGAVATGVALIVAVDVINTSVIASFQRAFAAVAGPADLEVTLGIGEVGFDEGVVEIVRRDPDVATAVPFVHGTVAYDDDGGGTLQLFGADLTAEDDLARYGVHLTTARRSALAAMEDPNGIMVAATVADRLHLAVGSTLRLATARGIGSFTVRGLVAPEGLAAALAGQLAVMDVAAAQLALAKEGRIDQIDVTLRAGADVAAARAHLAKALPAGLAVDTAVGRTERYADILYGLQATLASMSLMCMVAGLFVIHNGMAASVVHRMPVMATLRMVGATATDLLRLLLTEALVVGLLGAVGGAIIGIALGRVLLSLVGNTLGTMVQMRFIVPELAIERRGPLLAIALGVVVALVGAWLPARQGMQVDPMDAARGLHAAPPPFARLFALWGALLAVASALIAGAGRSGVLIAAGTTLWYLSASALGVMIVAAAAPHLGRWLPRWFGIEGTIAAASVGRAPIRAGLTVVAIAYVFAIAITLGVVIESYVVAAREYVIDIHDGDLVVSAVATEGGWLETPVGVELAGLLAAVDGVERVEAVRMVPGQHFRDGRVGVLAFEPAAFARLGSARWIRGDLDRARGVLAAGEGVAVSTVFADVYGVDVGDRIELETPTGILALPVVGILTDMSSSSGTIVLSRALYAERWHDPTMSRVNVFLRPGVDVALGAERITAAVGSRYRLKIQGLADSIAYIDGKIRDAFAFSRSLQLLLVIVAIAGIFDLLFARILERRRELAIWRIVGAADRAVRRSLVIESLTLGVLATVVGFPFGLATSWMWVRLILPRLVGYDIGFAVPALASVATVAVVLAATALAGRAAAVRATRASVLDGIRVD